MMDRLRALKVFVAVADAQSFSSGARELDLSRSLVSKIVMELEEHLQARLLNRTTRRVSLTPTGEHFLERARRILADMAEAEEEAGLAAATVHGRIRMSVPMSFGISHVAPAVADFMCRFPEVTVDLMLDDRWLDLVDEGFDLAIRIGHLADSSLIARRLFNERLVACASRDYIARFGVPDIPDDLHGHRCLDYGHRTGESRAWTFHDARGGERSVRIAPVMRSNNGEALLAAAIAGNGIVVLPTFIAGDALADGRLVRVLAAYRADDLPVHVVYPETRLLSVRVRALIDHLVDVFAQ